MTWALLLVGLLAGSHVAAIKVEGQPLAHISGSESWVIPGQHWPLVKLSAFIYSSAVVIKGPKSELFYTLAVNVNNCASGPRINTQSYDTSLAWLIFNQHTKNILYATTRNRVCWELIKRMKKKESLAYLGCEALHGHSKCLSSPVPCLHWTAACVPPKVSSKTSYVSNNQNWKRY